MGDLVREPLYAQIVDLLRREVAEGKYPADKRFPSERELAARFGISRTTANKVLSMLVADGQLQYRKGVGSFVAGRQLDHDMSELLSFTEKARRSGLVPRTEVLEFVLERHPELGDTILMERLRSVDGVPVILEKRWLTLPLCAGVTKELAEGSLYGALRNLGIEVSHAEQRARAVVPGRREQAALKLRQGCACLRVEGRGYRAGGGVIWEEDTLFRGDRFEIHGILAPGGTSSGQIIRMEGGGD